MESLKIFFIIKIFLIGFVKNDKYFCTKEADLSLKCVNDSNRKCIDPPESELAAMFNKNEFHFLSFKLVSEGSADLKPMVDSYPKLKSRNYKKETIRVLGHENCSYSDYKTDMERSLCPWKELYVQRDYTYPRVRRFAECLRVVNCTNSCNSSNNNRPLLKDGKLNIFHCTEIEHLEFVLFRSLCVHDRYTWEVGLEYVSKSCSCMLKLI